MRRALSVGLLLFLPAALAAADDPKPAAPAKPAAEAPLTSDQAADAALAAANAKDAVALRALAAKDKPDPWIVADALLSRGEREAAAAFASAAPRKDVESLPAYVRSLAGTADDVAARGARSKAEAALTAGKPEDALAAIDAALPKADSVVKIRLLMARGRTLDRLKRLEEGSRSFLDAGDVALRLGWLASALEALGAAGLDAYHRSDFAGARAAWERALAVAESRDDRRGTARMLSNLGVIYDQGLADYPHALEFYERAMKTESELDDREAVAMTLQNIAIIHYLQGDPARALEESTRVLEMKRALKDRAGEASMFGNIGGFELELGERARAQEHMEEALRIAEEIKDVRLVGEAVRNFGSLYESTQDYARAIETWERAFRSHEESGDRYLAAVALGQIGLMHRALGDYADALLFEEHALERFQALGLDREVALCESNLGNVYFFLGDYDRALGYHRRALDLDRKRTDKVGAARTLASMGAVLQASGDAEKAVGAYDEAIVALREAGEHKGVASVLLNRAMLRLDRGEKAEAMEGAKAALAEFEKAGERSGIAEALNDMAQVRLAQGDAAGAQADDERALAIAEEIGARDPLLRSLGALAERRIAQGDPKAAIALCRRGVAELSKLGRGLAEGQGANARVPFAGICGIGARAGAALGDGSEVFYFLESGRAYTLLEALGGRAALEAASIPRGLRDEELRARMVERLAHSRYQSATARGVREEIRAARHELDVAEDGLQAAVERIQREASAGAGVVFPGADALSDVQRTLASGDALVLYGLSSDDALAMVVTGAEARVVALGKAKLISDACAALGLGDSARDASSALGALAALVVAPLRLGPSTQRVLVSAEGALAEVPFGLRSPEREICCVPSGTTYRFLKGQSAPMGSGVLAVADPDYRATSDAPHELALARGMALVPLPGTREEARAVGDVLLLGPDANEPRFREEVAKRPRWRSVHMACHGLVDAERPMLSSLALTPSGEGTGFLTALDVFRMKIPSDLVVLSACETGKGKIVKGEGIVGLMRAFMFAGSPRVICSLWKVDDEATRALMTKFYSLWNPKDRSKPMGTAAALKAAQEHVRSQDKWKHPYYWAAWELWGLPE